MSIHERFEKVNDDYLKFGRIKNKMSGRSDLHAFLLLDGLFHGTNDMISATAHDEIYLEIKSDQIEKLTDDQILELVRCGIRHDSEYDCLAMSV